MARQYANPLAIVRNFPLQKRLIDAQVFYELGNYESAAIILMDVMEAPGFIGNIEYEPSALLLSRCLLEIGNLNAARAYLTTVTNGRDPILAEEARYYLIDLALTDGSEALLREIIGQLGGQATSDRTRYGLGKGYLRLGDHDQAIMWFQVIGPTSEFFAQARYYLGVAYTAKGDYPQALNIFRSLTPTQVEAGDDSGRELLDLTWLAVGRLQVEVGDLAVALTSYQNIGRYSQHYEVALYEMAWAYIAQEQYDKALVTIDTLLLNVTNERIDVDAHVLRGRLNVMMDEYDEALESYSAIIDRFAPIRNELKSFARGPEDIQRYFHWLLERQSDRQNLRAPLTERTAQWIESTDAIGRVADVFARISQESADIAEARRVGADLERILTSRNRVELFPNLRDGWIRALALQNRLLLISGDMLDTQNAAVKGRVPAAEVAELDEMVAWRRSLDERVQRLPQTFEGYDQRRQVLSGEFYELERKGFIVEQSLAEVRRHLLALEKYLNNKQFADSGSKLSPAREAAVREELMKEKVALEALFTELEALKRQIEIEARAVGTGDAASRNEKNLRESLLEAHRREGRYYDRLGMRLGGPMDVDFRTLALLRVRIENTTRMLGGVIAAIDQEVGLKTTELRGVVRREVRSLEGFGAEVASYDAQGRHLSDELGERLFRQAQRRMDEVVLEANVGVLDVVWERKQRKTDEMQKVSAERSDRLRTLQDDLQLLKHGTTDELKARAAAGGAQ